MPFLFWELLSHVFPEWVFNWQFISEETVRVMLRQKWEIGIPHCPAHPLESVEVENSESTYCPPLQWGCGCNCHRKTEVKSSVFCASMSPAIATLARLAGSPWVAHTHGEGWPHSDRYSKLNWDLLLRQNLQWTEPLSPRSGGFPSLTLTDSKFTLPHLQSKKFAM